MSTTATTREQYEYAWRQHIKELTALALAANVPYNDWELIRDTLNHWIVIASANANFKE